VDDVSRPGQIPRCSPTYPFLTNPPRYLPLYILFTGPTCTGSGQRRRGFNIPTGASPHVALRYRAAFASSQVLSSLPSPARAAYSSAAVAYGRRDRGLVGEKNEKALDSKAKHFGRWLVGMRFNDVTIRAIKEHHVTPLIVAYIHHVAYQQGGLQKRRISWRKLLPPT
jgi:hypothetical protein